MPLSDNEQKILLEIEKHLHESDPHLSKVGEATIYRQVMGSARWNVLGFLVGLGLMVGTLQIHFMLAFGGFLVMLLSALALERNMRLMGRAGVNQVASAFRAANPNIRRQRDGDSPRDGERSVDED